MNLSPTYRIYLAAPLGLVDTPFIITSVYSTEKGLPRSEWFLVIPEGKGVIFSQRNTLDIGTLSDDLSMIDETLLLDAALDQAKLRLRRYILENKGSFAPLLLVAPLEVQPCDQDHLVKLWLRGSLCGSLSDIRAKSECTPLIDLLVWIHGLPMLASNDL